LDAEAVTDPELGRRLQEHISVLQRSIDAIVHDARRSVRTDLRAVSDASEVVRRRTDFWQALAEDQGRETEISIPTTPLRVPVAADDLADLVDVLVDNVFAHTPEATPFAVHLVAEANRVRLVVVDRGPGLSGPGGDRPGSTGVGLDLARRTAAAAGGRLVLKPGTEAGTAVEVTLPLLAA
jgi:signal transduction histidine kinase